MAEVEWAKLKAHELRRLAEQDAVVIVPVAAMEQHGPHLPVHVDTRLAGEVSRRGAVKATEDCSTVVLPVIWHGLSEHHMPFGGTITLDLATFQQVFRCVVGSVVRQGFKRILILNGHGGNIAASQLVAQELALEFDVTVVAATYWNLAETAFADILEVQQTVLHAGEAETSMMLALEPEGVDTSALEDARGPMQVGQSRIGEMHAFRWQSFSARTHNGVFGDPSAASAEKGELLFDAAASALAELITSAETWADGADMRPDVLAGVAVRRG